jgi:hypothetical protein
MNREQITEQIMRILGWPIAVENDPDGMTRTPIFSYEQRVELGKLRRAYVNLQLGCRRRSRS